MLANLRPAAIPDEQRNAAARDIANPAIAPLEGPGDVAPDDMPATDSVLSFAKPTLGM